MHHYTSNSNDNEKRRRTYTSNTPVSDNHSDELTNASHLTPGPEQLTRFYRPRVVGFQKTLVQEHGRLDPLLKRTHEQMQQKEYMEDVMRTREQAQEKKDMELAIHNVICGVRHMMDERHTQDNRAALSERDEHRREYEQQYARDIISMQNRNSLPQRSCCTTPVPKELLHNNAMKDITEIEQIAEMRKNAALAALSRQRHHNQD